MGKARDMGRGTGRGRRPVVVGEVVVEGGEVEEGADRGGCRGEVGEGEEEREVVRMQVQQQGRDQLEGEEEVVVAGVEAEAEVGGAVQRRRTEVRDSIPRVRQRSSKAGRCQ